MSPKEKDAEVFGENAWIYCHSHMMPHGTGWCGVDPRDKIKLDATGREAAYAECRTKGFELYGETKQSQLCRICGGTGTEWADSIDPFGARQRVSRPCGECRKS